jgi:hypothetical protein
MLYCFTVLVFSLVMIFGVAPRYGRSNPLVYISICSLVGSVSVMAIKGFGVAVKLTFGGNNQFTHPSTYAFGIVVVGCILVQMNFFNKALDTFSTNVYVRPHIFLMECSPFYSVNPMYYVGFSTATIVSSLILFQGFNTTDGTNTVTLLAGFIVTFLGVHLLNLSRKPDPQNMPNGPSTLESGFMNPRMSLQGRVSLDGWGGLSEVQPDGALQSSGHGRRSSIYRAQSTTLFNAFEEEEATDNMPLSQLRESEEEYEYDSDVDERTRLHSEHRIRSSVSRSHSNSPALQGSARNSPRP